MKILISACLIGEMCRYDGESKPIQEIQELCHRHTVLTICPEEAGGLPTPRPPAERQKDGSVKNETGMDVSDAYHRGAYAALVIAKSEGCALAILKERSPSCGKGEIYDGTFTHALTAGDGVTAALLTEHGIPIIGETEAVARIRAGIL